MLYHLTYSQCILQRDCANSRSNVSDWEAWMWNIFLLHGVNIFMEGPRSNNIKTEAALAIVQTWDMWKTSEDEVEQLWTCAANITHARKHTDKNTQFCPSIFVRTVACIYLINNNSLNLYLHNTFLNNDTKCFSTRCKTRKIKHQTRQLTKKKLATWEIKQNKFKKMYSKNCKSNISKV